MKCENYLCIYEEQGDCLLQRIELDVQGQCKECIYIDVPPRELRELKDRLLTKLEETD